MHRIRRRHWATRSASAQASTGGIYSLPLRCTPLLLSVGILFSSHRVPFFSSPASLIEAFHFYQSAVDQLGLLPD